ncbi:NAD-dependent epimerase/dehydratase family protein [Streptomyces sp. CT34]|uniref:NAD-dependent epimerase/dehydratase family protein n=1 Tax=Streptomyces sp. CT34 TaxID=1553907 RepID=UPI0005BBAE33|nr:NAD-dependent epimerase/dehydratase family protein [Streptomyces sp. CT34]
MPRTLITGGFGFLATWVAAGLRKTGHEVVLVDHRDLDGSSLAMSGLLADPGVTTGCADITQPGSLDRFGPADHVIHAAAILGVTKVRNEPTETLRVNIDGTRVALDYAVRSGNTRRFLLLSTSEVYGADAENAAEDSWLAVRTDDPRWSYAVSKIAAESLAYSYHAEHGLPFTIVRPFNVFGPLRTGGYAVGALAARAVAGEPVTVHGDGSQSRAWCHAEDFANGLIRCLLHPDADGRAFNIGDDRNDLTVTELAGRIRDMGGSGSPIVHVEHTAPDIELRRPDLTRARQLVGYEPVNDFDDRLRETVEWIRQGSGPHPMRITREDWPVWDQ